MIQVSHLLWALVGHPGQGESLFNVDISLPRYYMRMLAMRLTTMLNDFYV